MQQVVPAASVLAALRPGEVFAVITLTTHGGWSFLLRDGAIDAAPVEGNEAAITALVVASSGPLLSGPFALLLTGPADPSDLVGAPWLIRQMTIAHVP